ncbi:MAG: polyamine aminopropyltransferase [Planctomycetaceae bacterium]|nr:MAG: polyamine aminopropyltransferase [Planctomycetaceae bacterium]
MADRNQPAGSMSRAPLFLLYFNVLVVATCGLVYELLAGTLASYVLGDSVTQFSLVIGVYLSALGVGAWLSRYVKTGLARTFIEVEFAVALLGGCSAPLLFLGFASLKWFHLLLFLIVFLIGTLVGLELPLLMRLLKEHLDFSDLVSQALTFDYIGALLASLLFPLVLVPRLGLVRTSLVFGILNAAVGLWGTWLLRPVLPKRLLGLRLRGVFTIVLLVAGVVFAERLTSLAEDEIFPHPIIFSETTSYQRIVVTQATSGFQLYLNGNLQFTSVAEYRYHEALVHPALAAAIKRDRVLVLGGGDGLAVREVLKYSDVTEVVLVDIDPAMTRLGTTLPPLRALNAGALEDPRVRVVNADALVWLETAEEPLFDAVIIDFPDPNSFSLGKLYTTRFYRLLRSRISSGAAIGIQCTSPLVAPQSYWCVIRTLEAAGFIVRPYQASVPAFGVWGFALATAQPVETPRQHSSALRGDLRFLNAEALQGLFELARDLQPVEVEINRLDNQALVRYYEAEWSRFN